MQNCQYAKCDESVGRRSNHLRKCWHRHHYVPAWKYCYATTVLRICWPRAFNLVTHMSPWQRYTVTHLHRIFQRILKHAYLAENTKSALGPMTLSLLNWKFSSTTKNKQKNPATVPAFYKLLHSIVARQISTSSKLKVMPNWVPFVMEVLATCCNSMGFFVFINAFILIATLMSFSCTVAKISRKSILTGVHWRDYCKIPS